MKYSVITPVYNREDCVARCLDSVIENLKWGVDLEHIVVDDGSYDQSANIVQKYAMQYPHIHFLKFDNNRGTNAARNAAIAAATGAFCIILDSDDYFVPDAMRIVDNVVSVGGYKHYCFAADDMVEYYRNNPLINETGTTVLKYEDFLLERVVGDFIHAISTETLLKYPFDENLRIYEGVFFKLFFREAGEILFTPTIVTMRERERSDSVTRDVLLKDKKTVRKALKAKQLLVEWFENDLLKYDRGKEVLNKSLVSMFELNLLLCDYEAARIIKRKITDLGLDILPRRLVLAYKTHAGALYFAIRKVFVYVKFDLLKHKTS